MHFAQEARLVLDIHRHVLRPDDIELAIGERQIERVALLHIEQRFEAAAAVEDAGGFNQLSGQIDPRNPAAEIVRKVTRRAADTAADIEHMHVAGNSDGYRLIPGGRQPAGVEMLHRRQAIGAEALGVLAAFAQCRIDAAQDTGPGPVVLDIGRPFRHLQFSAMMKKLISRPSAALLTMLRARSRNSSPLIAVTLSGEGGASLFRACAARENSRKAWVSSKFSAMQKPAASSAETISSTEPRKLFAGSLAMVGGSPAAPPGPRPIRRFRIVRPVSAPVRSRRKVPAC